MTKTAAELLEQYFKLKDHVETQTQAFNEKLKPYRDAMDMLSNQLLNLLNLQGVDNIKAPAGTVYKSTVMAARIANQDSYLHWAMDNWAEAGKDTLRVAANIDGVRQWMQANNDAPPPGVEISFNTRCNLRKS